MFASRRIISYVASATLTFGLHATTIAQPFLTGPALQGSPVEAGTPPATLDKRTQNTEQLRFAQRTLDTNGAVDKVAAQDVAFYQTRDAVLSQQELLEQRLKELEARKAELKKQLESPSAVDKTCTFAELDGMKDELAANQSRDAMMAAARETWPKLSGSWGRIPGSRDSLNYRTRCGREGAPDALHRGKAG